MKKFIKNIPYLFIGILTNFYFTVNCFALKNEFNYGSNSKYQHGYNFKADLMFPISGVLKSQFGWATTFNQGHFNEGIYLLSQRKESPLFSPTSGKVVYLNFVKDKGETIGIKAQGYFSIVAFPHGTTGNFGKKVGDYVKKGEKIGVIQNGMILFEVRDFNGNPYDPIKLITHKKINTNSKNQIYIAFKNMLLAQGFRSEEINKMYLIANMESSLNPSAINYNKNGTVDIGLFQINSIWQKPCGVNLMELYDVNINIKCALTVLRTQGLNAWVTWKKYLGG